MLTRMKTRPRISRLPRYHKSGMNVVEAGLVCGLAISTAVAHAQDRTQGRAMVISRHGIVATEHPLASQAGAMVLAHGGNAVDAAIAANAVMGVVSPMMNGIGGDLFAIVYEAKNGKYYGLNASGWAPTNLTPARFEKLGITDGWRPGGHARLRRRRELWRVGSPQGWGGDTGALAA